MRDDVVKDRVRDELLDVSKGLAIILVIVGHIHFLPTYLIHFIFSFHMPVFVFLSGIVFKQKNCLKHLKQYFLMYIIYAVVLSMVDYLVMNPEYKISSIVYNIVCWGGGAPHRIEASPALWFLTAIIVIQVLCSLFFILYKKKKGMAYVSFICIYIFAIWATKTSLFLPYNLITSIYLMPYFLIGVVAQKLSLPEKLKGFSQFPIIVIVATLFIAIYYLSKVNGLVNIFRCTYGKSVILYNLLGVLGCILIYTIAIIINSLKSIKSCLCYLGENTVPFMCTHQLLYKILEGTVVSRFKTALRMIVYLGMAIIVGVLCAKTIHAGIKKVLHIR